MEIGKKIRELRIARNLTQEALAAELSVTPQAISKWECGTTTPDIQLLPDIAIFFGVTLDELFCLTDDNELDRIQNRIWDSRLLPQAELERAERFLQSRIEAGYRPGRCWCLRAQLHNHQAQQHHALAAEYARQALAVSPTEKDAHSELCEATGGTFGDWCVHNHALRIAYYREFVAAHPDYPRGYLWLLDDLIADGRLTEARAYLVQMARVDDSYRVPLYRGKILRAEGRMEEARACWAEMEERFPDEWLVSLSLGDLAAELQDYDAAERYYRRALTQQAPPRYVDALESLAILRELRGDPAGAIAAREEQLELYRTEWNFTEGETADSVRRDIARLREQL